jgi:hypothetical protein
VRVGSCARPVGWQLAVDETSELGAAWFMQITLTSVLLDVAGRGCGTGEALPIK